MTRNINRRVTGLFISSVFFMAMCCCSAAVSESGFDFSSYNMGIAVGCVVDTSGVPVEGANVSLAMPGATSEEYRSAVMTDSAGCYRLPVPLGTASRKFSAKKLLKSSKLSFFKNPKSVTRQEKFIYNSIVNIKVEKAGFNTFTGVNRAVFGDPKPFEIYLGSVALTSDSSEFSSTIVSDGSDAEFMLNEMDLPGFFRAGQELSGRNLSGYPDRPRSGIRCFNKLFRHLRRDVHR